MYFNFSIAKWLNATLDLEIIEPALNKFLDSSGRLQNMHTSVWQITSSVAANVLSN